MPNNPENESKARWVFEQVFSELHWQWAGPEFEFDTDRYKARIDSGPLKGQLVYIPINQLTDRDVSALSIKMELLDGLKKKR